MECSFYIPNVTVGFVSANSTGMAVAPYMNNTNTFNKQIFDNLPKIIEDFLYQKVILFICVFGLLGNTLNLIVLTRRSLLISMERLEKSSHMGLIALAFSDLLFCCSALPHSIADRETFGYDSINFFLLYEMYGNAVINIFIMSSTWLTVAMAMSRYLAICHPIKGRQVLGMKLSAVSIVIIFIFCIVFNLPRFWMNSLNYIQCAEGWLAYFPSPGLLSSYPLFEYIYMWLYFIVCILIPLIVLAYCNVYLVSALRKSSELRRQHSRSRDSSAHSKNILTLTLTIIVLCYICFVTPAEILTFTKQYIIADPAFIVSDWYNLAVAICNTLQAFNFAFNFVLYCLINATFRRTIRFLFRCQHYEPEKMHMTWSARGYSTMMTSEHCITTNGTRTCMTSL